MVADNHIKPIIERVYPFNEAIEAFNAFEKGHSRGKIVIHIQD
jgi:NADPH:quinone reductase-like Zn-dependent oxidoreductase